jgi:hypothetical protein
MVTEETLYLANKTLEWETPPRAHRAEQTKEVGKMHGHVVIQAITSFGMKD